MPGDAGGAGGRRAHGAVWAPPSGGQAGADGDGGDGDDTAGVYQFEQSAGGREYGVGVAGGCDADGFCDDGWQPADSGVGAGPGVGGADIPGGQSQGLPVTLAKSGAPLTIAIGNIEPGRDVTVSVQYVQALAVVDGVCTFGLGTSGPREGESGIDLTLNAGMPIERIASDVPAVGATGMRYREAFTMPPRRRGADFGWRTRWRGRSRRGRCCCTGIPAGLFFAVIIVCASGPGGGGADLSSPELGEVEVPEVGKGRSTMIVGRLPADREVRHVPV